jgi:gliding motility-associated-like protein
MKLPLLILLTFLLSFTVRANTTPCDPQDSLALVALYNSTNGINWTSRTNWLVTPVSNWQGVKVINGRVTEININNNNLTGSLPPELGNLTLLTSLKLYSNAIAGPIPSKISKLTSLTTLYLSSNRLSGVIPPELGQINSMVDLQLASNSLIGSIPTELGNLQNLTTLYLHYNQLSGSIPPEMGNLTELKTLYLYNNLLTGSIPVELGLLPNLQLLLLNNNNLTGSIPASLGSLSKLTYLYLHYNKLSDSIPAQLGNLSNLYYLYLNNNTLRGTIPSSLGSLKNLRQLYLQMNQLQGTIPAELGNLPYLQIMNLSVNQLEGSIPAQLGNLAALTTLDLSTNLLSDTIPAALGNLSKLIDLTLDRNRLSGNIPKSFNRLAKLKNISMNSNQLSGFLADSMNYLADLSTISLYYNNLTFEDLEDKMSLADLYFYFSPQNNIGSKMLVSVEPGANYTLTTTCGGIQNRYQWFFKDNPLADPSESPDFRLMNIQEGNIGSYYCKVTSTLVTGLTLQSEPIIIQFTPVGQYPPTDILISNNSIDENLPVGTLVGTFSTADLDEGESHFYSLVDGEGSSANNRFFIAANQLRTALSFDYEKQNSYSIRVQTEDETGNIFQKIFTITVNDINEWVPTDILLSTNTIDEHLPAGTIVGSFSTLSGDSLLKDIFTYTLVNPGDQSELPATGNFYIQGNELRTLQSFDFTLNSTYTITVKSSDSAGDSITKDFAILINDLPEELPTDILLSNNTINENAPIGTFIGTLSTQGEEHSKSDDFTYTLVDGDGSSDNGSFFIAVNQLRSNEVFNFEQKNSYSIRVETEDSLGNKLQKQFTILVIDLNDTYTITIPDAFSPNGDGKNDFFVMPGIENYTSAVIDIYNRYGNLVFHSDHYGPGDGSANSGWWDGRLNANGQTSSKPLPEGYYFVVLKIDSNTIFKKTIFLKE